MTQRAVAPPHSTPLLPLLLVVSLPLLANLLNGSLLPCVGAAPEVGGTPWATPALEALDEQRDAEILQSVINSMAQWKQKHTHKKYQREKRASESVVCYESVGCFRDAGPFSYLDMLPSPPEEVSTQFLLYSRHRPHGPALLVPFTNLTSVAYSTTSSFSSVSTSSSSSERRSGYARPVRDSPLKDPNNNTSQTPSAQKVPSFSTSFSSPSSSDLVPSTAFSPSDWLQAGLNVSAPTKVIVHGFGSSCSNVWVFEMRSALMSVEECNVICVDWEAGATIPNYVRAAANTRLVGKQLALLLGRLRDSLGLDLQRVHLIGFSLGAHVAGFTGSELQNLSRITGLDPAGPLFENQDPAARLDSSDATFVDVVHSNGENLILGGLGSWQPMGHVDFYPNGGRMQKGCSNLFVGAVSDIFWSSSESHGRSLCNHRRAYKFFTDSVSPRCHFPAIPCESYEKFLDGECFPCSSQNRCGNMGYYADRSNGRGTLFLITRDEEPFCAHQYLVKVESTPSALPVISYGRIQITILGSVPEANETFTLTHKDDEELKAGGSLSRIIVPHPVMEEPIKVEVLYKAYSGWISSGLTRWSIDKVTIGDSFGKSASFCKKGLILESNVPVMLPLYPGDCNPPIEAPTYSPSVPIPRPPIPTLPNAQLDTSDSRPSQDKWPQTANDNEVKSPNKVDGSSTIHNQETTRIPTQVVYVGDEGLEPIKEETPEKNDEKRNENKTPDAKGEWEVRKNTSKSEALMGGIGAGQEDPLLSPQIHSINDGSSDETDSSWQPLTNDGSSNSLSPDGPGSREDGARAFVDPAEAKNNIEKRNDSLQASPKDAEADKQSSQSKRSPSPVLHSHWRPRHIPIYGSSLYEPRGGWHPEMSPPELDPPPIHAPLTWQHWVGYENEFLKVSRELPSSTSKNVNVSDSTTISTSTMKLMPTPTPTNSTATTTEASGGPFAPVVETVQLLPQRLAAFLARAEEYARVTLSGMVLGVGGGTSPTGSASSMGNDSSDAARRKPKYFPPMSSGGISSSEEQTLAINAPAKSYPSEAQTAPIAVPSQPTSVSAMGRGLPQYYPRAIVGRGSEHTLDVKSGGSIPNYAGREKGSQETKSSQSGSFGESEMSEPMLGDAPQPVQLRKSEMSSIQSVVRPQRGISTSATERMLDMSVRGKGGIMQHWQKLDTVDSHHQPRYIPLRRSSMSQENPRAAPRRNPPPPAFVMPRKR